jgi:hypothetical protein
MADEIEIEKAQSEYAVRLKEREDFESDLQAEVKRRLDATVVRAIEARVGSYNQDLHRAIVRNLLEKFNRDSDPLLAHFAGLKELPMDDKSRDQRLTAFEEILNHYLPGVLREEVPMGGDEDAGAVYTEKLNVN